MKPAISSLECRLTGKERATKKLSQMTRFVTFQLILQTLRLELINLSFRNLENKNKLRKNLANLLYMK